MKKNRWWSISHAIKRKMLHMQRFSSICHTHQSRKFLIHVISQHVKHDTIAIYFFSCTWTSANMGKSNLHAEEICYSRAQVCSLWQLRLKCLNQRLIHALHFMSPFEKILDLIKLHVRSKAQHFWNVYWAKTVHQWDGTSNQPARKKIYTKQKTHALLHV